MTDEHIGIYVRYMIYVNEYERHLTDPEMKKLFNEHQLYQLRFIFSLPSMCRETCVKKVLEDIYSSDNSRADIVSKKPKSLPIPKEPVFSFHIDGREFDQIDKFIQDKIDIRKIPGVIEFIAEELYRIKKITHPKTAPSWIRVAITGWRNDIDNLIFRYKYVRKINLIKLEKEREDMINKHNSDLTKEQLNVLQIVRDQGKFESYLRKSKKAFGLIDKVIEDKRINLPYIAYQVCRYIYLFENPSMFSSSLLYYFKNNEIPSDEDETLFHDHITRNLDTEFRREFLHHLKTNKDVMISYKENYEFFTKEGNFSHEDAIKLIQDNITSCIL